MKVYFCIWEEANVREAFAKFHESLGFPKIIRSADKSAPTFPDYLLEDAEGNLVRAEAKYNSSSATGLEKDIDLVICWVHDWQECPATIKVLNLSEHINDPNTFFKNLAIDIIDFLKKKDPSIEVFLENYSDFPPSLFTLSKKFEEQEIFINVKCSRDSSDGVVYYSCEQLVPSWLVKRFDLGSWTKILSTLQDKKFTLRRIIEGVGTSERMSEITISRSYKAKDLMNDRVRATELLSNDVITVFDSLSSKKEKP